MNLKKYFGPSTLVAAAFIGPGTVTTCSLAGVYSAYSLIWALVFSTLATLILQEMSARLGFITRQGLGEAVRVQFDHKAFKIAILALIVSAVIIGNAAYEAGNITGAVLGLELLIAPSPVWPVIVGTACFLLLLSGKYGWIENFLITLVLLMSVCFLVTAVISRPDIGSVLAGLIPGAVDTDELLLAMGLIGTTVVPYNLFLHASVISKKWKPGDSLKALRLENAVSVILGGLISILILIVAAASRTHVSEVESAKDLAVQLEPILGDFAGLLMGTGLMAAGLSSALTAALAAAYVMKGLYGIKGDKSSRLFIFSWAVIIIIGTLISMTGINSILLIKFAQITNALLLPIMAGFLVYACNSKKLLEEHVNSTITNVLAVLVIGLTMALSLRTLFLIF